jgi:hypothetical protein
VSATMCKGSSYRYAPDNEHSFTFVSEGTGKVCIYCNAKGGE